MDKMNEPTVVDLSPKEIDVFTDVLKSIIDIKKELQPDKDIKHLLAYDYISRIIDHFLFIKALFQDGDTSILLHTLHTSFSILYATNIYFKRLGRLDLICYAAGFEIMYNKVLEVFDTKVKEIEAKSGL